MKSEEFNAGGRSRGLLIEYMAKKGFIMTQEHKDKISAAKKGKPLTWLIGKGLNKGFTPWNKGVSMRLNDKLIEWRKEGGEPWNKGLKGKDNPLTGRKVSEEGRKNMSKAAKKRVKDGTCNLWKGGVREKNSKERRIIMDSFEYKEWRKNVFTRDNYTCQICGTHGVAVQADHIMPFAEYPELRTELSNGRTLCVPCHKKTDSYGSVKKSRSVN